MDEQIVQKLAGSMVLGSALQLLRGELGRYEFLDHWKQGEFHHDVLLHVHDASSRLPGPVLIIATNCNGGVKEVLCLPEVPGRSALWHWRCPQSHEFEGDMPPILAHATTMHWFDPCELLGANARSELKPEHRQRQRGGGWEMKPSICGTAIKKGRHSGDE